MKFEPNDPALARKYFEDKLAFTTGPVELSKAIGTGSVQVIDVRAADDYEKEHVPGSVNLPEKDWTTDRGLARDRLNVLLCYSEVCHLAARAAVELAGRGYPVMEMQGGFAAWKAHKLPTESGAAVHEEGIDRARAFMKEARTENPDAKKEEAKPAEQDAQKDARASGTQAKPEKKDEAKPEKTDAKKEEAQKDARASGTQATAEKMDEEKEPSDAKDKERRSA